MNYNIVDLNEIDESTIIVSGIDTKDYPDFADSFIQYAEFKNGAPLTDEQLDELNKDSDFVYKMVLKHVHQSTTHRLLGGGCLLAIIR